MENPVVSKPRKRASKVKVKSGCSTCKIRRVKCDETKPECKRCLRYLGTCSGYIHELEKLTPPQPQRMANLLPKLVAVEPLCRSPTAKLFNTDQEYIFFQRFCHITLGELTALRGSELWSRVVLQATEEEPCLRHAAIAVGALDFQNLGFGERSDDPEVTPREFAYSAYHKAIVGLRKALHTKDCTIMIKLISCILFACFEAHHRNNETALRQLFAGIGMIEEYSRLQKESSVKLPALDEDLVQAFALLEIQASAMGDQRSAELHLEKLRACNETIKSIPAEFNTLKDAEHVLYMNMLRGIHLRFSGMNVADTSSNVSDSPIIGLGTCSTHPAISELSRILGALRRWDEAFQPLYRKAQSPQGSHLLKGATILRMHYLSSVAWTAVGSPGTYGGYTQELKEIVELAKSLIYDMAVDRRFSLDMIFVLPLAVVGWGHRHRALRREVIDLFRTLKRREAIWDAAMIGKVMEWMAEIEEEGLGEEEYVPEDVVANIANLKVDGTRKSVLIGCIQGLKGVPGKTVYKEKLLYWGMDPIPPEIVTEASNNTVWTPIIACPSDDFRHIAKTKGRSVERPAVEGLRNFGNVDSNNDWAAFKLQRQDPRCPAGSIRVNWVEDFPQKLEHVSRETIV